MKNYKSLIKNNIVLTYGLIGLLLWLLIYIFSIQYDQDISVSWLFYLAKLFQLPFWLVSELVSTVSGGRVIAGQQLIAIIGGLGICIFADFVIRKIKKA